MSSPITQYLMPFGAFFHDSGDEPNLYRRKFDTVNVDCKKLDSTGISVLDPSSEGEAYIKMTLHDGLFAFADRRNPETKEIEYFALYVRPKTSGFEFFRTIADFTKILEVPKDMETLVFDFGNLVLTVKPNQYNHHDRLNTVKIYVPEKDLTISMDNGLWDYLKDFAKMQVASQFYLRTYGEMCLQLS